MREVPPGLARYISSFEAYDVDLGGPGTHRGLPTTSLTLVLSLQRRLEVGWSDGTARAARWGTVSGLHTAPAVIGHGGRLRGLQLGLTPAGSRALLGVPAAALAGQLLDLEEVAPALADLPEQLDGLDGTGARATCRHVFRALAEAVARHGEAVTRPPVARGLAGLTRGARVADVADDVGYSRRRLTTLVREETGLSAKAYQRVARFQASRSLVGRFPLAQAAAASGYADQAHLAREWSELAGCSPSTWLREEFPFVQDLARAPDAG